MKLKTLILIFSMIYLDIHVNGQETKSKSKCYLIFLLMNAKQKWLALPRYSTDSTVNILDPEHLLDSCNFTTWREFRINIINSGTFIDSVKRRDLHFLTNDKPNYYAIREYKAKGYWELVFHHGFDNTFVQAPLKIKHKWYYMGKIEAGVE